MNTRRRSLTRLGVPLLGVFALLVCGRALWRPLIEEWNIRRLESTDPAERSAAARRLGRMRSIRAIPALVHAVARGREKPYYGERFQPVFPAADAAAESLVAIGRPAIPAILELFKSDDSEVIQVAAAMLGEISPDGRALRPHLLAAIERLHGFGLREVSVAVGAIGLPAVPAVLAALGAGDPAVRRNGARILTSDLLSADSLITARLMPVLTGLLDDEDASVRDAATEALARVEGGRIPLRSTPARQPHRALFDFASPLPVRRVKGLLSGE